MTSRESAPRGLAKTWLLSLVEAWWIYLFAPAAIGVIGLGGSGNWTLMRFAAVYAVSACATLGIGSMTQLAFVYFDRDPGRRPRALEVIVAIAFGVLVGTEIAMQLINLWGDVHFDKMRRGMWAIGGTCAVVLSLSGLVTDRLRERAQEGEAEAEAATRQALEAKLSALQARMDPHFLFNSLNTLAALIEEEPKKAVRAVEQLSDLFRYTVERGAEARVTLAEEMEVVRAYLSLEALRFEDKLKIVVDVEPACTGTEIPPLLIQPLVENAVKHGVARSTQPVRVSVEVRAEETAVVIEVEDDAAALAGSEEGSGTALLGIAQRLDLCYGDEASLEHGPRSQGGYRARITLPRNT